jgi:hypothetical protein
MSEIDKNAPQFPLIWVGCDCDDPVTEVNILFLIYYRLNNLIEVSCLKMKLSGRCPCGYFFDTFNDAKVAIAEVRLHFERVHTNLLPFGITDAEALALLKKGKAHGKHNVSLSNYLSA